MGRNGDFLGVQEKVACVREIIHANDFFLVPEEGSSFVIISILLVLMGHALRSFKEVQSTLFAGGQEAPVWIQFADGQEAPVCVQ
jgi:hypothetical protein